MTKLLVVDDNEQNRYMLQALLMGHGYDVTVAADGAEALEKARANPPDMIITDILMPGMDGYTLCRHWKRDEKLKEVPLVFYTGTYTDPKDEQLALSIGAERFILKPQEPEILLDMIEKVLEEPKAARQTPPVEPIQEEAVYVKGYNKALVRKLEDKLAELESAKATLEYEVVERKKADEALRKRETQYRELVQNANSAIIRWKRDGAVTFINEYAQSFFGYDADEILGKHIGILVPERDSTGADLSALVQDIANHPGHYISNVNENVCRDGRRVWMAWTNRAICDAKGEVAEILCVGSDITERKHTEEALRQSEVRFRSLFANMTSGVAVYCAKDEGADFVFTDINEAGLRIGEVKREDVVGRAVTEVFPGIRQMGLLEVFRRVWRAGITEHYPTTHYADGRLSHWYENHVYRLASGEIVAIYDDVTERKRAEEHANRVGLEWQRTFDATNSAVWILGRDQRIVRSNKTSERIFHHSCDEIIGRHCWEIVHGAEAAIPECPILRVHKSLQRESQQLQIGEGWFEITVDPILDADGQYAGAVHVVNDIAERKRGEHALLASETRYRRLFESAKDGILILDAGTGAIVDVNPFLVDLLGFPREYFLGKKLWEIGLFKDVAASEAAFLELQEKEYIRYEDLPLKTRGGRRIEVEFVSNVYPVDSTTVVQCNIRDITERRRTEEALALHTRRVQALLDLQLLSQAEEDKVLDFALDACLGMTQSAYSFVGTLDEAESVMTIHRWSKEVMGECALPTQPIEYPVCAAGLWGDCVRRREPVICNDYQAPHPNKKGLPDGHVPIHRFVAVPVLDANCIVAVAAVANKEHDYNDDDASALSTLLHKTWEILSRQRRQRERETLEEQYRQAQKMEAVGQLAGGVAHDFNNILQAIVGYSSMLLDRLPEHAELYGFAEEIARGAERAAALTRQLLTFSRRQVLEMENLDLNEVVHGVMKMIRRVIGEDVTVEVVEGSDLGIVHADRGQMEQVLLNLCVNARDAMPKGGVLTIGTEDLVMDSEYCAVHAWASPGRYVLLSVTDTGCGMDAQTQTRIFEPFYTTKELGKGTGLGLATVYGILKQHQGMVQVYSEEGKGTTFKVYLPSFERAATTVRTKVVEPARGGSETILVAEDDDASRKLTARILEDAGYTVLLAANGEKALEVFGEHAAEVDLAVLDVVMPKMGGKAVYDVLRQRHPSLRFLFSSGYSTNAIHTGFVREEGVELIQKPYAPDALLRKVRRVLDRDNSA